jgi:hypothetical protein
LRTAAAPRRRTGAKSFDIPTNCRGRWGQPKHAIIRKRHLLLHVSAMPRQCGSRKSTAGSGPPRRRHDWNCAPHAPPLHDLNQAASFLPCQTPPVNTMQGGVLVCVSGPPRAHCLLPGPSSAVYKPAPRKRRGCTGVWCMCMCVGWSMDTKQDGGCYIRGLPLEKKPDNPLAFQHLRAESA